MKGFTPEAKVSIIFEFKGHINKKIQELEKKGEIIDEKLIDKIIKDAGTPKEVALTYSPKYSMDWLTKTTIFFFLLTSFTSILLIMWYSQKENIIFNIQFVLTLITLSSIINIIILIMILKNFEKFRSLTIFSAFSSIITGSLSAYMIPYYINQNNMFIHVMDDKYYSDIKYQFFLASFCCIFLGFISYFGYLHITRDTLDGVVKKRYYYFKIIPFIGIFEIILTFYIYYFLYEAINKIVIFYHNWTLFIAPILLSSGIILIYIYICYFRNPTKMLKHKKGIFAFGLICLILCSTIFHGIVNKEIQISEEQEIPDERWYVSLEKILMDSECNFYYIFIKDRIILIEKYDFNFDELLIKTEIPLNFDNNYINWYIEDAKIDPEDNLNIVINSLNEREWNNYYKNEKIHIKYYFVKINKNLEFLMKKDITNLTKFGNLHKNSTQNKTISYDRDVDIEFKLNKTIFNFRTFIYEVNNKENEFLIERIEFINDEYIPNIIYLNISNNFTTDYYHWINPSNSVDNKLHFLFYRKENSSIEYIIFSDNGTLLYSKIIGELYYGGIISFTADFDGNPVAFFTNYDKKNKIYTLNFLKYENNKITIKKIFEDDKLSAGSDIKVSLDSENNFRIIRVHSPKRKEWKIVEYPLHTILYYKINSKGEILQSTNISIEKNSKTYNEYGKKLYISSFYNLFLDEKNNMYIIYNTNLEKEKYGGKYDEEINNKEYIKMDSKGNVIFYKNLTPIIKISNPYWFFLSILIGIVIPLLIIIRIWQISKK